MSMSSLNVKEIAKCLRQLIKNRDLFFSLLLSVVGVMSGNLPWTASMVSRLRGSFEGSHLEPDYILALLELFLSEFSLISLGHLWSQGDAIKTFDLRLQIWTQKKMVGYMDVSPSLLTRVR